MCAAEAHAAAAPLGGRSPGVVASRRSTVPTLLAIIRNPLEATPPEAFHEPLVFAPLFGRPRFYLTDPALIQEALVRGAENLSKGRVIARVLAPAFGGGLLSAEGAHWRHQRRAASPAFQHDRLQNCVPAMIRSAERTRDRLLAAAGEADISHAMAMTTFAIIAETMLSGAGREAAARFEREIGIYLGATGWLAVVAILGLPRSTIFPGRSRAMAAAAWLRAEVGAMVAMRRAASKSADGRHDDLVSLLLDAVDPESGRGLSDPEIVDNILTFIAAGHETTAQGLAWTLRLLAREPEIEAALVGEVAAVTRGDPIRPHHVPELVFTRQVFSEAMRLYPPAPMIERHVDRDLSLAGCTVRAGAMLVVPIHALHRSTRLWDAPDRFDPGRFAPDRAKARHRYSYMPFGAGPRSCIGSGFAMTEAVAILAVLMRDIRFLAIEADLPEPRMRITLRPARPIRMAVARR